MTWKYKVSNDGLSMDVFEDDPEYSGKITTLTKSDPGFTPIPEVKRVMRETWEKEANLGSSPVMNVRAGYILMDLVTENIEEGSI